ncbi:MAG: hypothetical protein KC776_11090 [Myxococcales bacterium]|nr:hypothetical protein [Myxococcales bacterium]
MRCLRTAAAASVLVGCSAVVNPPGYDALARSRGVVLARASILEQTGDARTSLWKLPDGRRLSVRVLRRRVQPSPLLFSADLELVVSWLSPHTGPKAITCTTEPEGPDAPETRFGCRSQGDPATTFWIAPGLDCPARPGAYIETLRTPACWNGRLAMPPARYSLEHAHLTGGRVAPQILWSDATHHPRLAARFHTGSTIELFGMGKRDDVLVLHTLALGIWQEATGTW